MKAAITIDGKDYTVARVSERHDERLYQALIRVMTAAEKPPPNPWALKDADGRTLALGERVKKSFAVSRGEESFSFRKARRQMPLRANSMRPSRSFCQGSDQSLGSVGQEEILQPPDALTDRLRRKTAMAAQAALAKRGVAVLIVPVDISQAKAPDEPAFAVHRRPAGAAAERCRARPHRRAPQCRQAGSRSTAARAARAPMTRSSRWPSG